LSAPTTSPAPTTSQSLALGELRSTPAAATALSTSQIELATPLEDDEDRLDAFYDDEPLHYRTVTNIIGNEVPPGLSSRLFAQLHLTHADKPTNYAEAKANQCGRPP
jgi:hypothetical protein